jgi:hypothetical protein
VTGYYLRQVVILADISYRHHQHVKHMLNCLNQANNTEEYIKLYLTNNPILDEMCGVHYLANSIKFKASKIYLETGIKKNDTTHDYHFLLTAENFNICKQAAKELTIIQIYLDLMDIRQCEQLAHRLIEYNAMLKLCNFTNIHYYDSENKLLEAIKKLLPNADNCLVMYATGTVNMLRTQISYGLKNYFSSCFNEKILPKEISKTYDPLHGNGIFSFHKTNLANTQLESNLKPT